MNKTKIEWVKNPDGTQGYTWNPITGCLNHDNGLCKGGGFPCYAYKLANGRLKQRYLSNSNWCHWNPPENGYYDPFYPRFWEERLEKELPDTAVRVPWSKERGIFVCDMGDLFGIGVPEEWTAEVLARIEMYQEHRLYLLTKQPQNLIKFSPFPDNCWVGVTSTNENMAFRGLSQFLQVEASIKYLSLEPLLGRMPQLTSYCLVQAGVSWLIIGACTGTYSELWHLAERLPQEDADFVRAMRIKELYRGKYTLQPRIEWVREIVEAADKAGVKVFLKDNLDTLLRTTDGQIPTGLCDNYGHTLRQEMPNG